MVELDASDVAKRAHTVQYEGTSQRRVRTSSRGRELFYFCMFALIIAASGADTPRAASERMYHEEGFVGMPRLVSPRDAVSFAALIDSYLTQHGSAYEHQMGGQSLGGWYISDFPSVPMLATIQDAVLSNHRLQQLLTRLLGPDYRLLARSELYVDRRNGWHMDGLYGYYALYNNEIDYIKKRCGDPASRASLSKALQHYCDIGTHQVAMAFRSTDAGERQQITTVALYLGGIWITLANATARARAQRRSRTHSTASPSCSSPWSTTGP